MCFPHEEWEVREIRAHRNREREGGREGLCVSEQGISFMQIFATQDENLHL